jgi:hypothetical protein
VKAWLAGNGQQMMAWIEDALAVDQVKRERVLSGLELTHFFFVESGLEFLMELAILPVLWTCFACSANPFCSSPSCICPILNWLLSIPRFFFSFSLSFACAVCSDERNNKFIDGHIVYYVQKLQGLLINRFLNISEEALEFFVAKMEVSISERNLDTSKRKRNGSFFSSKSKSSPSPGKPVSISKEVRNAGEMRGEEEGTNTNWLAGSVGGQQR